VVRISEVVTARWNVTWAGLFGNEPARDGLNRIRTA